MLHQNDNIKEHCYGKIRFCKTRIVRRERHTKLRKSEEFIIFIHLGIQPYQNDKFSHLLPNLYPQYTIQIFKISSSTFSNKIVMWGLSEKRVLHFHNAMLPNATLVKVKNYFRNYSYTHWQYTHEYL